MNLGKAVKLIRTQRAITQAELAARVGISVSYLSLLERSKRDPSFSTVQSIANALNVPLSLLVFLGAEQRELEHISPELVRDLSYVVLKVMEGDDGATAKVSA